VSVRLGAGAACAAAVWLCASSAAAAGPTPVLVPSPTTSLTAQPPLGERNATLLRQIPLGRIAARTRVVAELDARGAPTAVSAVQRLTIHGVGDYFFAIPAPVRDVLPGPGTQSEPGLRTGMVLWQGFSGGKRILSARLVLEPAQAAPLLPMRVRLSRTGSLVTLELANATTVRLSSFTAVTAPDEARRYVAELTRFAAGGPAPSPYLNAKNVRVIQRTVVAPLRVTGALVFPSGKRTRLDLVLGAGRRSVRLATASTGLPKLALVASTIPFDRKTPARPTFDEVMERALRAARARQYDMFVASPDPGGTSRTTYVFRTVASRIALTSPAPRRDSGFPVATLAIALGFGVLLAAGVVAWAHA
jgi:hypothetical protein